MGPEGLLTLRGGCFLVGSPPHPTLPRAPAPPGLGRRLGGVHDDGEADGKGPGRGPASVPGEGGREGGLQQVPLLEEEPRARLQLQWQQEAIPVHLLPPGWPAVSAGALPLSVPPRGWGRALTGGWTEGARVALPSSSPPPPLAGSMASGHSLQRLLCAKPLRVMVEGQVTSGNPCFLSKLLFWQMMSWKFNRAGGPRETGAGLASIP